MPQIKACLYSKNAYPFNNRVCGLYPLERLIHVLSKAGIKTIYLDLSKEENFFYEKKIQNHVKKIKDVKVIQGKITSKKTKYYNIPSNMFMQSQYFDNQSTYFERKDNLQIPKKNKEQFLLKKPEDFKKAINILKQRIIDTTGGAFLAKKLNKRISLPISSRLAATRVNPNFLTFLNFCFGILSAFMILKNTYWSIVIGGFLLQFASIFDGVDGEVAKFTFKVSKFGGWFDTITDYLTTFLFISACSYLFFHKFDLLISLIFIGMIFIGTILYITIIAMFLKKFEVSGSLNAYETKFLAVVQKKDKLLRFILSMKIIAKKDFYSLLFFLIALTGQVYLIIPFCAVIIILGTSYLLSVNIRYLPKFNE